VLPSPLYLYHQGGAAAKGSTWTYPSPQMFYNALARKGKLDDTVEEDIESVVALHNNMNEKTWKKVLEWEETVSGSDEAPKLLKFQGRPTDLSPKAAFKHYVLGHPLPYDRHDWTVERADGTTVRYVIDYYHDESRARDDPDSALPDIQDATASSSLLVDVRPAADGPAQVWNRVATMPYARHVAGNATFEPLPMLPPSTMQSQVKESVAVWQSIQAAAAAKQKTRGDNNNNPLSESMSEAQAKELAQNFATMLTNCRKAQAAVVECETEAECARASIDLTLCMGQNVCPLQHEALIKFLSADDDGAIEEALTRVNECVTLKTQQHALAKEKYPKVFQ
jgi:cytochrome c heme-lyase